MIEIVRKPRKGEKMNIKKVISKIDLYMQRHCGATPMTQHDKQIVSGHILPLITQKPGIQEHRVDVTKQPTKVEKSKGFSHEDAE